MIFFKSKTGYALAIFSKQKEQGFFDIFWLDGFAEDANAILEWFKCIAADRLYPRKKYQCDLKSTGRE